MHHLKKGCTLKVYLQQKEMPSVTFEPHFSTAKHNVVVFALDVLNNDINENMSF